MGNNCFGDIVEESGGISMSVGTRNSFKFPNKKKTIFVQAKEDKISVSSLSP